MRNNCLVSIIVPIYKTEEYLSRCIESISNQTYRNIEIILVDDGATDKSAERAEKLGIYDALTKTAFKETYNKIYLENQSSVGGVGTKKPTVAESTAVAENATVYEATINDLYNRVYKTVKVKLDSANTMLSSISKLISRRMSEIQTSYTPPAPVSYSSTTGNPILNEDYVTRC